MKKTLSGVWVVGLAVLLAAPVHAQRAAAPAAKEINVREPKGEPVSTPEYDVRVSGGGAVRSAASNWLRVESEFMSQPVYMDEVTFTYYALLKAKKPEDVGPGGKQLNLFSGEVTYVDVPKGRWKSNMFLPPATFARYGDVEAVGVQVKVKGVVVEELVSRGARARFWEGHPVKGGLYNRDQTPYIFVSPDEHPAIRPATRNP